MCMEKKGWEVWAILRSLSTIFGQPVCTSPRTRVFKYRYDQRATMIVSMMHTTAQQRVCLLLILVAMLRMVVLTLSFVTSSSKITTALNVAAIVLPTPRRSRHSLHSSKLVTTTATASSATLPLEQEQEAALSPLKQQQHRRFFIQIAAQSVILPFTTTTLIRTTTALASDLVLPQDNHNHSNNNVVQITLTDPSMKLGLQLANRIDDSSSSFLRLPDTVDTGTTNGNSIVYVQRIVVPSARNANIQEGMILRQYNDAKQLQELLLRAESYPITLEFQKPNDTGPLDAPSSSSSSSLSYRIVTISPTCTTTTSTPTTSSMDLPTPSRSQRGNVLSIIYEARLDSPTGRIYDASYQRGTQQQPYQMVLGSGDMIIGVDQGLYDMCLGEVRGLEIPSRLAYGDRGNRMFQIPPNRNLYWKVQLVRID